MTKVFVVIAAILSVALSSLVIAYAVNTDRINADYQAAVGKEAAASAQLARQQAEWATEQTSLNGRIRSLETDLGRLTDENRSLQNEKATLQIEKERAEAARTSTDAKLAELGESVKTLTTLVGVYRDEISALRRSELTAKTREVELNDRLNDLMAQRMVMEQNYRALLEELAERKRDAGVAAMGGVASAADQPFDYTGAPIFGRVLGVSKQPGSGKTLITLSVGSNDRVAKNMKFRIARGGAFVGQATIIEVDLKSSIAEVTLGDAGGTIDVRDGDLVQTRFN